MNASTKRNLWQFGGSAVGAGIGAFVGNPMLGAKLGGIAGSGLGNAIVEDDTMNELTRLMHPTYSPMANKTTTALQRPSVMKEYGTPEPSTFDNIFSVAGPLMSAGMPYAIEGIAGMGKAPQLDPNHIAQEGMAIPPQAPSHDEGGVPVEVEGGEIIFNAEQLAYIDAAPTPEEKAMRYEEVVSQLKAKGMDQTQEMPMAEGGLFAGAPVTSFNSWDDVVRNLDPSYSQNISQTPAPLPEGFSSNPFHGSPNAFHDKGFQSPLTTPKFNPFLNNANPEQVKQAPVGGDSIFDRAMAENERLSKLAGASDMAKSFIHAGSLFSPEMPLSKPFSAPDIPAPSYKDHSTEMKGSLDESMASFIGLSKDMSPEQRIANYSNMMGSYNEGLLGIASHVTDVSNLNEQAVAQTAAQNIDKNLQLDTMNYQKTSQENQMEHMRKNAALAGLFQSVDAGIQKKGQSTITGLSMEMLQNMMQSMEPDEFAKAMAQMGISLGQ